MWYSIVYYYIFYFCSVICGSCGVSYWMDIPPRIQGGIVANYVIFLRLIASCTFVWCTCVVLFCFVMCCFVYLVVSCSVCCVLMCVLSFCLVLYKYDRRTVEGRGGAGEILLRGGVVRV